MSGKKLFFISAATIVLVATVTTCVLGNTRASIACGGDDTGFNCLYQTNHHEYTDVRVEFDRDLPSWLTGTLIRNGLGMFERGQQSVTHVFDGFAKLSSWKFFPNGTTFFSTRFVRSDFYKDTMSQNHLEPYMLFNPPDPPFTFLQRQQSMLRGIDNMNINLFDFPESHGGDPDFAALSDYWNVYEFSGTDLSTKGLVKPTLSGGESMLHLNILSSAHPLPEPGTSNRLTFLVRQRTMRFLKNRLSLVRMSSISGRSLIAEWKLSEDVPYMHSFAVTQTKAVLLTGPMVADSGCLFKESAPLPCMKWFDDKPSTLYIADLKTGRKKRIKMKSTLFAIHHINAYDLYDDEIIMDVVSYDSMDIVSKMLLMDTILDQHKRDAAYVQPRIRRVVINLSTKKAEVRDLSTTNVVTDGFDMPAINEKFRSEEYCYAYGMNNFADGEHYSSSAIIKKDMCNGGTVVGELFIPSHYPVEPAFVPNPQGVAEDDGVLLVPMLRGEDAVTYLAVVDAQTMAIVSKADMPDYLPFSLHGKFIKDFY